LPYTTWKEMIKAIGSLGSGAGTTFWNKYLRNFYGKRLK
jgi:hypothetical protein